MSCNCLFVASTQLGSGASFTVLIKVALSPCLLHSKSKLYQGSLGALKGVGHGLEIFLPVLVE